MLHRTDPPHRTARAIARRTDASVCMPGTVGVIVLLMLVWGGIVASGLY